MESLICTAIGVLTGDAFVKQDRWPSRERKLLRQPAPPESIEVTVPDGVTLISVEYRGTTYRPHS